jgi:hypothetical protein
VAKIRIDQMGSSTRFFIFGAMGFPTVVIRRRTDVASGALYRLLRKHAIDPNVEAGYIAWKFGVDDSACAISRHDQPLDCS